MLSPSMEDYLEEVYRVSAGQGRVRVSDIAERLHVRRPSVVKALRRLASEDYLEYGRDSRITLTPKGRQVGGYLVERNRVLVEFLHFLGASDTASREAEAIEHGFSLMTLTAIGRFVGYMKENPRMRDEFKRYCELDNPPFPVAAGTFTDGWIQRGTRMG
ncbi:MAG: metal-dependent transcriptional regulator [Ignavibacteriales bacterium]